MIEYIVFNIVLIGLAIVFLIAISFLLFTVFLLAKEFCKDRKEQSK